MVIVVFSRKCLTFQTQQDVIDILHLITCDPKALLAITLSFPPRCPYLPYVDQGKGNEPSVIPSCTSGCPNTTNRSGVICKLPCHWPRRTKTKRIDLFLLHYSWHLIYLTHIFSHSSTHVTWRRSSCLRSNDAGLFWDLFSSHCAWWGRRRRTPCIILYLRNLYSHIKPFLRIYFVMTLHQG